MDLVLVLFMSFDTLLACIACSSQQISIPFHSKAVIACIGSLCLGLSFALAGVLSAILPHDLFRIIGCGALVITALFCLFEGAFQRLSQYIATHCDSFQLQFKRMRIVLEVYAENTRADQDSSGILSAKEAIMLALPLSLDSLLTGLSIVITPGKAAFLLCFSFGCGIGAAACGSLIGRRLRNACGSHASVISGIALLGIACLKWFL